MRADTAIVRQYLLIVLRAEIIQLSNTYNDQNKTNNDLQNITWKPKDRATRTSLKTAGELGCSGRINSLSVRVSYG